MNEIEITKLFKDNHFRATPQRIEVYKYLCENRTHPDADEIYKSVAKLHPSFSKTTVYNSLQALEEQGLIIKISIDDHRVRYDADTSLHGHFVCDKCKSIFDFKVDKITYSGIEGFDIAKRDVYFSGVCPDCKNKK